MYQPPLPCALLPRQAWGSKKRSLLLYSSFCLLVFILHLILHRLMKATIADRPASDHDHNVSALHSLASSLPPLPSLPRSREGLFLSSLPILHYFFICLTRQSASLASMLVVEFMHWEDNMSSQGSYVWYGSSYHFNFNTPFLENAPP